MGSPSDVIILVILAVVSLCSAAYLYVSVAIQCYLFVTGDTHFIINPQRPKAVALGLISTDWNKDVSMHHQSTFVCLARYCPESRRSIRSCVGGLGSKIGSIGGSHSLNVAQK